MTDFSENSIQLISMGKMLKFKLNEKLNNIGIFFLILGCPAFTIFFTNYVIRGGFFVTIDYLANKLYQAGITYIPMLLVTVILTLIFRKVSLSYLLMGGISIIGGCAYYFKMMYRGEVLWPTDLVFASAVGTMAEEFNIQLTAEMKEALIALAAAVLISHIFTMPKIRGKYSRNIALSVVMAVLLALDARYYLFNIKFYREQYSFSYLKSPAEIYHRNTFHTAFVYYINILVTTPPDNYSEETVNNIITSGIDEESTQQKTPDIILILAESYFQPEELFDLEFSEDISENYRRIAQKGVYGNTLALKYGGGTGEIEFSCLNQINIGMFVDGISYMNNFGNEYLPSFIHRLKESGYETHALHAHTDLLYNRRNAYKNMGIDNMMFSDTYKYADRIGNFVDDNSNVLQIIDTYETFLAESDAENIFITSASMQNHMPMTSSVLKNNPIRLLDEGYSETFTEGMSVVATYQNLTDESIGKLYDYFENVDREVVVIIYGDHQNYRITEYEDFSDATLAEMQEYADLDSAQQFIKTHTTPFIMWSNKTDLGGVNYPLISIHNMYSIASKEYGLPQGDYENYLYNLALEYPVVDDWNKIFIDKDGNLTELDPQTKEEIFMISYDMLYGEKYAIED